MARRQVQRCQAVAGLSLGEYTALTVAGVFDFQTGLEVVKLRGELMQAAAEASQQAMLSVAGLDKVGELKWLHRGLEHAWKRLETLGILGRFAFLRPVFHPFWDL